MLILTRVALAALAVTASVALVIPGAGAIADPAPAEVTTQPPAPTVLRTERIYPPRVFLVRTKFTPQAHPSPAYVFNVIVPHEAARWGAPAGRLACRIFGESGGHWNASNGQYQGVGQFGSETFHRGLASIGSREVRMVKRRVRVRRVRLTDHLSDGSTRERMGWARRQRVIHVYRGVIPPNPDRLHAWAQVRIMARALVGLGRVRDSEWEVRC